jgi:hypothetical protein
MSEETTTGANETAADNVTYLGSIALEKEQVQKIVVSYLVNNNPELQTLSGETDKLKFRPVWLSDDSFMEIHFTRKDTEEDSEMDLSLTDDS